MNNYKSQATYFRDWIKSVLEEDLGTYRFSTGQETQAIAIIGNRSLQFPEPGTDVSGLEAVVFYPESEDKQFMGQIMVCDNWEIQLRQWDRRRTTLEAKDKLINSAPCQIESTIRVAANAPTGYPETCRIVLVINKYLTQYPYV